MALEYTKIFDNGLQSATAYARISIIQNRRTNATDTQMIEVTVYANAQAYTDGKAGETIIFNRDYDDTASESLADIYTWIKTQPGFESAVDV